MVSAKELKGESDITSEYVASAFVWMRNKDDAKSDETWSAMYNGVKMLVVSANGPFADVKVNCTLPGTSHTMVMCA